MKVGAHFDRLMSEEETMIYDRMMAYYVEYKWSTGRVLSSDGTPDAFIYKNSFCQAAIRHIAFEIIESAKSWF